MENSFNWRDVPVPHYMKDLEKDPRTGFPIPYIIFKDDAGVYHFKINDHEKSMECMVTRICPICARGLGDDMWLVGGPLAAFHPQGAYNDTAMHYECGKYALQVCPYLATKSYRQTEIDLEKISSEKSRIYVDPTMIPGRPDLFVYIKISDFYILPQSEVTFCVKPHNPYLETEYWNKGKKISEMDAEIILTKGNILLGR